MTKRGYIPCGFKNLIPNAILPLMLICNGEQDLLFTEILNQAFETLLNYISRMAGFCSRTVDIVSMKKVGADMHA